MTKAIAIAVVLAVVAVPTLAWAVPQITGADIVDDSLTGSDVLESSLGEVPSATRAGGLAEMVVVGNLRLDFAPGEFLPAKSVYCPLHWRAVNGFIDRHVGPAPVGSVVAEINSPITATGGQFGSGTGGWTWYLRNTSQTEAAAVFLGVICLPIQQSRGMNGVLDGLPQ